LAVSSFRLRARLDVCIPSAFLGQRGITPAFGYGAPHLSARGTSTLLNNALLSAHFLFADYTEVLRAWSVKSCANTNTLP
jgi:hypothetical protein